jgi:glutamine amidotransferase
VIAVLDYGIGNLRSAQKALQHVGADAVLATEPGQAEDADGVVLPGVGAFGRCMEALVGSGLDKVALDAVENEKPFLAICIGMQLLYQGSEEDPGVPGLGVLPGAVRRLPDGVKRPQMQWNQLDASTPTGPGTTARDATGSGTTGPGSRLLAGLGHRPWVYFVHSYAPEPGPHVIATCDYGGPVVAAVERGRTWATQFHPEKSGATGLRLLRNFAEACGAMG